MLPKRQRLIGLKAKGGKPANDDLPVSSLTLKEGQKIMMMGQPEAHVEALDKQSEVSQSWQNLVALVWPQRWLPRLTVAGDPDMQDWYLPVAASGRCNEEITVRCQTRICIVCWWNPCRWRCKKAAAMLEHGLPRSWLILALSRHPCSIGAALPFTAGASLHIEVWWPCAGFKWTCLRRGSLQRWCPACRSACVRDAKGAACSATASFLGATW